jgi:Zn-dependent membrane protease YugP
MKLIEKYNLIDKNRIDGAKKVLTAAALTYIAGFVSSLGNLLYYSSILSERRRRD